LNWSLEKDLSQYLSVYSRALAMIDSIRVCEVPLEASISFRKLPDLRPATAIRWPEARSVSERENQDLEGEKTNERK